MIDKLEKPFDTLKELGKQSSETDKELVQKLMPEGAKTILIMRSWMDFGLKLVIAGGVVYTLYKCLTSKDERQKSLDSYRDNDKRYILPDRRDDDYRHAGDNRRDYNGRR